MTYGIIGSGAIGAYFGAKLVKAGKDVHFLFHSDYTTVVEKGLQVNSPKGNFHLDNIKAYVSTKDMPACDVIIVALKTVHQSILPDLLPPLLKPTSIVVLIQNGIGVEEDVERMFPNVQLIAGLAFVGVAKTRPGIVDHQDFGRINFGNYNCRDLEALEDIIRDFNEADISATAVEYDEARWKKAVWNMPFNGLSVVLNATTDQLLANAFTHQLVKDMMLEVIGAATALGVNGLTPELADKMIEYTKQMRPYAPSMKLDYDFHRPMEIDYLYTKPIEKATSVAFDMPKLQMLEQQLRFLNLEN